MNQYEIRIASALELVHQQIHELTFAVYILIVVLLLVGILNIPNHKE